MNVILTNWAVQSYLQLKHERVFTPEEYKTKLRPSAELLREYPDHPKFENGKFWSPGTDRNGITISSGFKMKWHNIGSGQIQLRLLVVLFQGDAYLCDAYVKDSEKTDWRMMARLKNRVREIYKGQIVTRGTL